MFSYHLGYKCLVGKEQHLTNSWNWLGFPTGGVVWCNSALLGREFVYQGWDRLRNDSPIHTAQSPLRCQCWCGRQARGQAWHTGELGLRVVLAQSISNCRVLQWVLLGLNTFRWWMWSGESLIFMMYSISSECIFGYIFPSRMLCSWSCEDRS